MDKTNILTNCAGTIGYPKDKKKKIITLNHLIPNIKTKSKCIIDIMLKPKTIILLEKNRRKYL